MWCLQSECSHRKHKTTENEHSCTHRGPVKSSSGETWQNYFIIVPLNDAKIMFMYLRTYSNIKENNAGLRWVASDQFLLTGTKSNERK